ncbi:MAG: hypothetical protein ACTS5P_01845 [Candidatus Hodgkinia cicadicola]
MHLRGSESEGEFWTWNVPNADKFELGERTWRWWLCLIWWRRGDWMRW